MVVKFLWLKNFKGGVLSGGGAVVCRGDNLSRGQMGPPGLEGAPVVFLSWGLAWVFTARGRGGGGIGCRVMQTYARPQERKTILGVWACWAPLRPGAPALGR